MLVMVALVVVVVQGVLSVKQGVVVGKEVVGSSGL